VASLLRTFATLNGENVPQVPTAIVEDVVVVAVVVVDLVETLTAIAEVLLRK
jgi:hypothetical protein